MHISCCIVLRGQISNLIETSEDICVAVLIGISGLFTRAIYSVLHLCSQTTKKSLQNAFLQMALIARPNLDAVP